MKVFFWGLVAVACFYLAYAGMMSRPTFRLKSWSVPPSSTSALSATES